MQEKSLTKHYTIGKTFSEGTFTKTFLAVENDTQQAVVIKALYFREMEKWKPFELFEREARVLENLNHERIPKLVEFFCESDEQQQVFYLVTEHIQGESLAQKLENGWRPSDKECINIATQLLEILDYIHSLNPPVIHRDIKPSNIIINEGSQVYLVDFGGVQQHLNPKGSSTIVGTFGYMAPEHFSGQSIPASDIYSLGATLIHLMAGKAPAELPQKNLTIDFKDSIYCDNLFKNWLSKMLDPHVEKRYQHANQALEALQNPSLQLRNKTRLPKDSPIQVSNDGDTLRVLLPAVGETPSKKVSQTLLTPAAIFFSYTLYTTWSIFFNGVYLNGGWPIIYIMSFYCSILLLVFWFLNFPRHVNLEINPFTYKKTHCYRGQNKHQTTASGHTQDIVRVEQYKEYLFLNKSTSNSFWARWFQSVYLGEGYSKEELTGLQNEILDYLLSIYSEEDGQTLLEASLSEHIQLPPKVAPIETLSKPDRVKLPPKRDDALLKVKTKRDKKK